MFNAPSYITIFLTALICLTVQPAIAFDRKDLSWGLTVDEAIAVLTKSAFIVEKVPVKNPNDIVFFHSALNSNAKGSLSFCNGRLAMYSPPYVLPPTNFTPAISSFVGSLAELTEKHGLSQYRVAGSKYSGGWLQHYWRLDKEVVYLSLQIIGLGQHISIGYVQPQSCQDKFS